MEKRLMNTLEVALKHNASEDRLALGAMAVAVLDKAHGADVLLSIAVVRSEFKDLVGLTDEQRVDRVVRSVVDVAHELTEKDTVFPSDLN